MKRILFIGSVIFLLGGEISVGLFAQTVRYVKSVEQGTGDGLSWDNASADLSAMLAASGIGDEIWVAAGTYVPGNEGFVNESFVIPSGVKLYGGFAGNEMSLNEANPEINLTIISGDIGTKDYLYDNIKRIIRIEDSFNNVIDGFIIQDAFCARSLVVSEPESISGIYSYSSADFCPTSFSVSGEVQIAEPLDACTPVNNLDGKIALVKRGSCTFVLKALAAQKAGAIAVIIFNNVEAIPPNMTGPDSNIVIPVIGISLAEGELISAEFNAGSTVIANIESGQPGGGMYITNSNPIIRNCTFQENNARHGSAIYAYNSALDLINCQFMQNSSEYGSVFYYESQVNIINCIFNSNNAWSGSAVYSSINSSSTIKYGMFESNKASYSAGAIFNYLGELNVDSCSFIENDAQFGGALYSSGNLAITSLNHSHFIGNYVTGGGAGLLLSRGSTLLKNCFFYNNLAQNNDSTLGSGGAIQIQDSAQVEIINTVLSNNQAIGKTDDGGGAIVIYSSGKLMVNNSTIVNNKTASKGGALSIYDSSGYVSINNSILWNNVSFQDSAHCIYNITGNLEINYSDIQDENLLAGTGNLNDDPLFININSPLGIDGIGMTSDDGLILQTGSPAIGSGSSASSLLTDILGMPWSDPPSMGAYGSTYSGTNYVSINEDNIYVYPNPAESMINLNRNEGVINIVISNIVGQVIWTGNYEAFPLNITEWEKGMYIIRCEKDGRYITRKFIKD